MSSLRPTKIWRDKRLLLPTKLRLCQPLLLSVLLYAADSWVVLCTFLSFVPTCSWPSFPLPACHVNCAKCLWPLVVYCRSVIKSAKIDLRLNCFTRCIFWRQHVRCFIDCFSTKQSRRYIKAQPVATTPSTRPIAVAVKAVDHNTTWYLVLTEIELSQAYLYRSLSYKDSDSHSIFCLALSTLQYCTATDRAVHWWKGHRINHSGREFMYSTSGTFMEVWRCYWQRTGSHFGVDNFRYVPVYLHEHQYHYTRTLLLVLLLKLKLLNSLIPLLFSNTYAG